MIRNPLAALALAMVAVLGAALVGLALDPTVITGRPAWLKPAKFAVSFFAYGATLLWILSYVRGHRRLVGLVSWGTALAAFVEMAIIVGQAARGRASHFNEASGLDAVLFSLMGLFIVVLWLMALLAAVLVLRQRMNDPALAAGLRAGLVATSIGMLLAIPMLIVGGHTIGAADGGPGLPIVGWSTIAGDLRPAHFLGLHAMQILPLIGWLLSRLCVAWLSSAHRAALVAIVGVGYTGLSGALAWQALRAQPLLGADPLTLAVLGALVGATALAVGVVLAHARMGEAQPRVAPSY
jgi:hypothetical protein